MELNIQDKSLHPIIEKIRSGERLTLNDGLIMYQSPDLLTIAQLANELNLKMNGNKVYFIQNLYINPTNVCEANCKFCGYRKSPGEEGAYTMGMDELLQYVADRYNDNIREFHIVGGHNHTVDFNYYVDTIKTLKKHYPHITIKAYTSAELVFFSKISGLSVEEVLKILVEAGLESLPGGGAEILTERYRLKMSPEKASTQEWLDTHELAHSMGIKTHTTMLYGLIETLEERLQHMTLVRELQDKFHGFLCFIPLAVQPKKATSSIKMRTSAIDDLKTLAISRLMLDNFDHIKAYWINIGTQLTQLSLGYGVSDIHGTLVEERISHSVGALTQSGLTKDELLWLIKGADKIPVERDTFYNTVKIYD